MPRPAKRAKLLDGSDDESDAGVKLNINADFAKRFEHNKKREEQHRLEEKYGKDFSSKRKRDEDSEEDDSSEDESEDDDAELATADLDDEIMTTLQAIKNKHPSVYDQSVKFYKEFDPDTATAEVKQEKPMYLRDYQREKLLAEQNGADEEEEEEKHVTTYSEEQEQLKRELVGSMHAKGKEESDDEDDFMVAKKKSRHEDMPAAKTKKSKKITDDDVKAADNDPETYLSNFMAARAWLPTDGSRFEAFESDDSDDDKRAEEFEEAYNMRFEDPKTANEKLQSFARDVGKYGVRREEKSARQKAREREKERKDAEKRERDEDKARLRKLKIEEAEEKVQKIKEAAGLRGQDLNLDEWRDVIEGDFDDDKWEKEMQRRFGDDYYDKDDAGFAAEDEEGDKSSSKHPKKPEWNDDIDIGDLVPDFDKGDKADFDLTEDEEDGGAPVLVDEDEENETAVRKKKKTKKDREKEKTDARRAARKERQKIEEMVDAALPLHDPSLASAGSSKAPAVGFRYRETSPTSFGLSSRDILFADDSALNSFAGLKKMASFRDEEKKRRDKKKFSKKARLRQWRRETFGKEDEPTGGFERVLGAGDAEEKAESNVKDGKRSKKRKSKKAKTQVEA